MKRKMTTALLLAAVIMTVLCSACGKDKQPADASSVIEETSIIEQTTATAAELTTVPPAPQTVTLAPEPTVTAAESTAVITEPATEPETVTEPKPEPEPEPEPLETVRNPLTNKPVVSYDELPVRAVAVSIGNNGKARPQSGLAYADIVYEVPAEGGVSRYVAIFYGESCDKIGPCRSARPYIVRMAAQFSAALAHVGGSNDALALLKTKITPDLDEFTYSSVYWRSKDRKAPDNCYTSTENLLKWYDSHNYKTQIIPQGFLFMEEGESMSGEAVNEITVNYPSAKNTYKYNDEDGLYYRFISGAQQRDKEGDVDICCANLIVQYINSKVLDDAGRLAIDLFEGGKALYFINGQMTEGKWKRSGDNQPTVFLDSEGEEMRFATGKTWIQMVDKSCTVKYE